MGTRSVWVHTLSTYLGRFPRPGVSVLGGHPESPPKVSLTLRLRRREDGVTIRDLWGSRTED